jgi:hypothetical protein
MLVEVNEQYFEDIDKQVEKDEVEWFLHRPSLEEAKADEPFGFIEPEPIEPAEPFEDDPEFEGVDVLECG